jgi:hypothetical protein
METGTRPERRVLAPANFRPPLLFPSKWDIDKIVNYQALPVYQSLEGDGEEKGAWVWRQRSDCVLAGRIVTRHRGGDFEVEVLVHWVKRETGEVIARYASYSGKRQPPRVTMELQWFAPRIGDDDDDGKSETKNSCCVRAVYRDDRLSSTSTRPEVWPRVSVTTAPTLVVNDTCKLVPAAPATRTGILEVDLANADRRREFKEHHDFERVQQQALHSGFTSRLQTSESGARQEIVWRRGEASVRQALLPGYIYDTQKGKAIRDPHLLPLESDDINTKSASSTSSNDLPPSVSFMLSPAGLCDGNLNVDMALSLLKHVGNTTSSSSTSFP